MFNIIELWRFISTKRKIQYFMVLVLMTFSSLAEMVSIGAVIPFLSVLIEPQLLYQFDLIQPIILLFDLTDSKQLVVPIVIIFLILVVVSGLVRLALLYFMIRLSHATGADIGINIYRRTLYQDYSIHITRNSSEVINGIITKTNLVIGGVVTPTLSFISSLLMTIGIIIALVAINIFSIFK
jgi:ATP-binding cassette, subfamily B, bacterial PglK